MIWTLTLSRVARGGNLRLIFPGRVSIKKRRGRAGEIMRRATRSSAPWYSSRHECGNTLLLIQDSADSGGVRIPYSPFFIR
jgi:hypothetical protein